VHENYTEMEKSVNLSFNNIKILEQNMKE
jgi:hypothetical protein